MNAAATRVAVPANLAHGRYSAPRSGTTQKNCRLVTGDYFRAALERHAKAFGGEPNLRRAPSEQSRRASYPIIQTDCPRQPLNLNAGCICHPLMLIRRQVHGSTATDGCCPGFGTWTVCRLPRCDQRTELRPAFEFLVSRRREGLHIGSAGSQGNRSRSAHLHRKGRATNWHLQCCRRTSWRVLSINCWHGGSREIRERRLNLPSKRCTR